MMMVDMSEEEVIDLLNEYNPLIRSVAHSACYSSASIDFADLCQVGDMAVLRAIKSYNPTYGTSIKSFVAKIVRQDVYNEAARFLGVFTVDRRVTSLAAKVNRLYSKGKTDDEIAILLNSESSRRSFDADHIRDLRIIYNHRQHVDLQDDDKHEDDIAEHSTIHELLYSVVRCDLEKTILEKRLLGNTSVKELQRDLNLSKRHIYIIENDLKARIRYVFEDIIE
jgi:RNA polymerase sigma factor (sigma-70 family)